IEQDHEKAVTWYTKAAEQGHADAQYNLAVSYDEGEGVERDGSKAVFWYTKAANQGNRDAQNNLGVMYDEGDGVA
ncbi:tetratricopeptide repeat protein, partial [Klebsiella aerogenes]